MRPRIPASWRTCSLEPRAPESAMMKIGLNSLPTWSVFFISRNISSEIGSVVAVPDVDDLVVALAGRDDAVELRWRSTSRTSLRAAASELFLLGRDDHVVDADGDAGLGRGGEAEVLQVVEHPDRHVRCRRSGST